MSSILDRSASVNDASQHLVPACRHPHRPNPSVIYQGKRVRKFESCATQAERRLEILDNAKTIRDLMAVPSNRFEALGGDRAGQCSIRVNQQWRICFEWKDPDACNVEIIDYHWEMNTANKMRAIHPGDILNGELEELNLSANAFAKALAVPANRITAILNQ